MTGLTATPTKLRDGSWGARVPSEQIAPGAVVTITTKSGKSWSAQVTRVVWHGNGVALCATQSTEPAPRSSYRGPSRDEEGGWGCPCNHGRECRCGSDSPCCMCW